MAEETKAATKKAATPAKVEKQEWEGSYHDLNNTQRTMNVTESDGTRIEVNFRWPGKRNAENIEGLRYGMSEQPGGSQVMRQTDGDFHNALFPYFGKPIVNGKPEGKIGWDWFDNREDQTYNYMMDTADSFLDRPTKANK